MKRFSAKAMRGRAGPFELVLEAADATEAANRLRVEGYTVLAVAPAAPAWLGRRSEKFPLVLFSQELAVLLEAGVPLTASLHALAEHGGRTPSTRVIEDIVRAVQEDRALSQALRGFPEAFPALYVAMVQSSERTGALADALQRYVAYRNQIDTVRRTIASASIYPLLLLGVGGAVVLFLLFYVVPRFSRVYEERGADLPLFSRWLVAWGHFVTHDYGWVVLAAIVAAIGAVAYLAGRRAGPHGLVDLAWRHARMRDALRIYFLARFYRSVGMLLAGGVSVLNALEMSQGLLHPRLREGLERARQQIGEGRGMTEAFSENGIATPVALRMMAVGESSGRMGEMLQRAASFHDEEIARWIDRFSRLFEPLLMALIGLVIGVIVVLMYMPIFELAGSLQ